MGFFKMRHPNFASKESLKEVISLNPRLPFLFGLVIFSEDIHTILCLSGSESHQKCWIVDWMLEHRDWGSLKHDMECKGIEVSTLVSIVLFPALDRYFEDQLTAFCLILSTMDANRSFFLLPKYPMKHITYTIFFGYPIGHAY